MNKKYVKTIDEIIREERLNKNNHERVFGSDFFEEDLNNTEPKNIPAKTPTKIHQNTLSQKGFKILKWVVSNLWKIALALIVAYLIYYFGWNKPRVTP